MMQAVEEEGTGTVASIGVLELQGIAIRNQGTVRGS
jgi:hypothetical protein